MMALIGCFGRRRFRSTSDRLVVQAAACLSVFGVLALGSAATAHPNDACMEVTSVVQQDDTTLAVVLAIEKTPQLDKIEREGHDEKEFFVRWAWTLFDDGGGVVRRLEQEVPLELPFTTVLLPHCEVPGNGNGSGGADLVEYVELGLANAWDGTDENGQPVPDGDYSFVLDGELVRVIDTSSPSNDQTNQMVVGSFGDVTGTFNLTTLEITAQAVPDHGPVPLAVVFSAIVEGEAALYEWDFQGDGVFDYQSTLSPNTIFTYTEVGDYTAVLRATSPAGRAVTSSVLVSAEEGLVANIIANPTSGTRPLTVRLTPEGFSNGPSITGYRWDFNGDGVFDTGFEPRPSTKSYTYQQAGTYDVRLQIRDATGATADDFQPITVTNPAPVVSVQTVPSNGAVPLDVTFVINASSQNGAITSVVLDPGDGSAPIELPGPQSVVHTYTSEGIFSASVTVTDAAGETATLDDLRLDVRVGPAGAPSAVATASPDQGQAPLSVTFDPSGSSDPDGTIVLYEWDFDFDGATFTADTSTTTPSTVSHSYDVSGTHFAALRVTDDAGETGLAVVPVRVLINVSLSVFDDTVDPYVGETVNVRTTLSAGAGVTVYLRDRAGNRARTLFAGDRPAGTYDDAWDGRDDAGVILLDGDYYAEIEYELDGETHIEPDTPSGGAFRFVSWTQNRSNGATWDPWEDQFWALTFDTAARGAGASEVTLWVTPYRNRSEITATLLTGDVFGSGRFTHYWAGVKDDGTYVEPRGQRRASGNDYLWSAQAFTLADNTVVVQGGRPYITSLGADPNIYDATTHRCLTGKGHEITLTLTRDSTVNISIFSMDNGNLLRRLDTPLLAAGTHTVEWDGKAESGKFLAPGRYRADIRATSDNGNVSLRRRALILVAY